MAGRMNMMVSQRSVFLTGKDLSVNFNGYQFYFFADPSYFLTNFAFAAFGMETGKDATRKAHSFNQVGFPRTQDPGPVTEEARNSTARMC